MSKIENKEKPTLIILEENEKIGSGSALGCQINDMHDSNSKNLIKCNYLKKESIKFKLSKGDLINFTFEEKIDREINEKDDGSSKIKENLENKRRLSKLSANRLVKLSLSSPEKIRQFIYLEEESPITNTPKLISFNNSIVLKYKEKNTLNCNRSSKSNPSQNSFESDDSSHLIIELNKNNKIKEKNEDSEINSNELQHEKTKEKKHKIQNVNNFSVSYNNTIIFKNSPIIVSQSSENNLKKEENKVETQKNINSNESKAQDSKKKNKNTSCCTIF